MTISSMLYIQNEAISLIQNECLYFTSFQFHEIRYNINVTTTPMFTHVKKMTLYRNDPPAQ